MQSSSDLHSVKGASLVIVAAILWGTTGTSQALAPAGADPLAIGTLRLIVGSAGLWLVAAARGVLRDGRPWPKGVTLLTGLLVAIYQLSFFSAVAQTGVAVGTMVALGSGPVFAGLLDLWFYHQRPSTRWCIATLFAILGCSLILGNSASLSLSGIGIVLALMAGLSYALYSLTIKSLLRDHAPEAVMAVVFGVGAICMSPLLLGGPLHWVLQPQGWLVIVHLGLLATALSYWLYARGLQQLSVSNAVSLALAEPLTAALLGLFFLGESVQKLSLLGMMLILAGLVVLVWPRPLKQNKAGSAHHSQR